MRQSSKIKLTLALPLINLLFNAIKYINYNEAGKSNKNIKTVP